MARKPRRGTERIPKPKLPPHRPPHAPDERLRNLVKWLRIGGNTQERISEAMSLDPKTLRKHYRAELDESKRDIDALMTNSIVMMGLGGEKRDWTKANITAAIFYAKTQMGWKEPPQAIAHSGVVGSYDAEKLKDLSDEELSDLAKVLARISPATPVAGGGSNGAGA
jgi:hypothetical protein